MVKKPMKSMVPIQNRAHEQLSHYRKSQTGMIAISVNSSASVLLFVISSTKQEIRFYKFFVTIEYVCKELIIGCLC